VVAAPQGIKATAPSARWSTYCKASCRAFRKLFALIGRRSRLLAPDSDSSSVGVASFRPPRTRTAGGRISSWRAEGRPGESWAGLPFP
jgi:hypothetical protein